jgi:hypothetical protein
MKMTYAAVNVSHTPRPNWLEVWTWVVGLLWLTLVSFHYLSPSSATNDISPMAPFFLAIACGLVAWAGGVFAQLMGAGARVLGQRQVPTRLWSHWLRTGLKKALGYFGFLALVAVTFSLPATAPWHGLTVMAVMSTALGVSVLRGLAFQGLVPRVGVWSAPLLVALLLVGSVVSGGLSALLRWIDNWPWIILFGVTASWTMLALMLIRRWFEQVPQVRMEGLAVQADLWKKVKTYARRYTPLTNWIEVAVSGSNVTRRSVFQVMFWPLYLFLPVNMLTLSWGHGVQLWQLWVLGMLAQLASGFLACKDLHWRMLLAPAGMRRGALGWHIVLSTATATFIGMLIAAGAVIVAGAAALSLFQVSFGSLDLLTTYLARIGIAPVYLIFVISVATLIRGTQHTRRWQLGLLSVWVLAGIAGLFWTWIFDAPLSLSSLKVVLFTVDYSYVLALLALSALAVWAANRLWTVDKLLRCAPK